MFNPSVWVIVVVAKRLVRFTKIWFFSISQSRKLSFSFLINGGILSVAHFCFCFHSTLIWLFLFANALRKVRRLVFGLVFVLFSTLTILNLFFRGLFNIYRRSVGLIGFLEGLSIDFCFQHFELRVWRTDIYCSNLQLAIETIKVDIKKYRGLPAY